MWEQLWKEHRGAIIGLALGLFFGIVYLIVGFWNMLVLAFLMLVGLYIGRKADRGEGLPDWDDLVRRLLDRWRPFR